MSHETFITIAYGVTLVCLVIEVIRLRIARKHAMQRVQRERGLEEEESSPT